MECKYFHYMRTSQATNFICSRVKLCGFKSSVLWEMEGQFHLIPYAIIENELEIGGQYEDIIIHREQCIPVDYKVAMALLGWEVTRCLKDENSYKDCW